MGSPATTERPAEQRSSDESLYRTIRLIRRFEERVVDHVGANDIAGVTHEYVGEEAIAAGICAALEEQDYIASTHRGHGHVIARGADPKRMMAELFGRETGLNHGRGGSMHIADVSLGILGANGIIGAGAAFIAGATWRAKNRGEDRVGVTFFGDGGINQGVLLETMNLGTLWKLPVIFVCENNGYALTLAQERSTAGDMCERAAAYGMPARRVDGMDARAVYEAAAAAVERGRAGDGPSFIQCDAYRFHGHHTSESLLGFTYRSAEEIERWRSRDPVLIAGERLDDAVRERVDAEVEELVDDAVAFAAAAPRPLPETATDYMYASGLAVRGVID